MKRIWILLLSLTLLAALSATAWAQTGTTQEEAEEVELPTAFVSLDLEAGHPLDPFIVSLNGGGEVPAADLDPACTGYIPDAPTLEINWQGETDFVEAFFYSDHDPVLVVRTPDGSYLCNDDANNHLLDPVVEISNPENGRYDIWVGSYAPDQLIPGILVLTTRQEINVGTFSLANLIAREPIIEDHIEAHEVNTDEMPHDGLPAEDIEAVDWSSDDDDITHTVTVSGTVAAFDISNPHRICNGFIHTFPDYVINVTDQPDHLRFFFEGDGDATLMVEEPGGEIHCNDDHAAGENLNPVVDIHTPAPGLYYIYVGRIMLEDEINGVLTISESVELSPAVLKGSE